MALLRISIIHLCNHHYIILKIFNNGKRGVCYFDFSESIYKVFFILCILLLFIYLFLIEEDKGLVISCAFSFVIMHHVSLLDAIQLLEVNVLLTPIYHHILLY